MGVTSEDTKLLSAARVEFDVFGSDTYVVTFYPAENSDKQAERLLALARRGAEVEGATVGYAAIFPSGEAGGEYLGEVYRDERAFKDRGHDHRWMRRVLILRAEP